MNFYGAFIAIALLVEYFLNVIATSLNLLDLNDSVPVPFRDMVNDQEYHRAISYTRTTLMYGMVVSSVSLGVLLAFWYFGGFALLDESVRAWGLHPVVTGVVYIGLLMSMRAVISVPFSLYHTFVIEERFGFNRTTLGTFVSDRIKAAILSAVIGGPLLAGILAFFRYTGSLAWLYCWLVTVVVMVVLQFAAPRWIMPLFNRFRPLEEGELRRKIFEYARSVDFGIDTVYVIDGSRRSRKSNAFFTGFGRHKRIALFDTLIEGHTVSELVGVLAHEIGHYKKRHIIEGLVVSIIHMGAMFYLLSLIIDSGGLFQAFDMDHVSVYAGFVFFGLLYTPVEFVLDLLLQYRSRQNEYAADKYAAETTGDPESLSSALKKLSIHNLSNLSPHPVYVAMNYSHPPVLARIRALHGD